MLPTVSRFHGDFYCIHRFSLVAGLVATGRGRLRRVRELCVAWLVRFGEDTSSPLGAGTTSRNRAVFFSPFSWCGDYAGGRRPVQPGGAAGQGQRIQCSIPNAKGVAAFSPALPRCRSGYAGRTSHGRTTLKELSPGAPCGCNPFQGWALSSRPTQGSASLALK